MPRIMTWNCLGVAGPAPPGSLTAAAYKRQRLEAALAFHNVRYGFLQEGFTGTAGNWTEISEWPDGHLGIPKPVGGVDDVSKVLRAYISGAGLTSHQDANTKWYNLW